MALPFVLPPFLIVTATAILYARYQGLAIVQDNFLSVAPAVLAIISRGFWVPTAGRPQTEA